MSQTPNFFIVGAPKAGTDALYYELDQHPEIYMSPLKEPCYFSSEIRPENFAPHLQERMQARLEATKQYIQGDMSQKQFGGMVSEWSDYLRLFAGVRGETAIGEGSVCYLWSKSAPGAIASRAPHSKIIIVLMDPAERAFAQYQKSVSDGYAQQPFHKYLESCFQHSDDRFSLFHPFLEFGMYRKQVERYIAAFPREQISISFYEDITREYHRWFAQILAFLGVDTRFVPNRYKLNRSGQPEPSAMRPKDRELLIDFYRNDILELEDLISRSLAGWLH